MKEIKFGNSINPRSASGFVRIGTAYDFPTQVFVAVHETDGYNRTAYMHLTYLQTKTLVRALSAAAEKLRKKKTK